MQGPYKKLRFNPSLFKSWGMFEPRKTYCVKKSFKDFDGDEIVEGYVFEFQGCDFVSYDEEYFMIIKDGTDNYYEIRLGYHQQKDILDNLSAYFRFISE